MKTCPHCQHELADHEIWATDLGGTLACPICRCMYSPTREILIAIRKEREGLCIRGCPRCEGHGSRDDDPNFIGMKIICKLCGGSGLLNAKVPTTQAA